MSAPQPLPTLPTGLPIGAYPTYARAQEAVDYLSDNEFEVQNMAIVGTELKTVERVTGRITRAKVAAAGAMSGLWMGLFVGLAFSIFGDGNELGFLISTPIFGAIYGLIWSQIGFAAITRGGTRDFSSVSQVVATKYEVLVEHRFAERARELLANMPGGMTAR